MERPHARVALSRRDPGGGRAGPAGLARRFAPGVPERRSLSCDALPAVCPVRPPPAFFHPGEKSMITVTALSSAMKAGYFVGLVAPRQGGREDYYAQHEAGVWLGSGAAAWGLAGTKVLAEQF